MPRFRNLSSETHVVIEIVKTLAINLLTSIDPNLIVSICHVIRDGQRSFPDQPLQHQGIAGHYLVAKVLAHHLQLYLDLFPGLHTAPHGPYQHLMDRGC
ncbi:hypothetical protein E2C01_063090 [Portunus trituberculatus]|uniref:Uncharacterized protein n=1 Tax=Portunus trituberculatus TaxID=210409 RepID=A0A5B7H9K6_PORTR|nr:hypothetical protein [Portunus trituberculatus]